MAEPREHRFLIPLPLDVEHILERLLASEVLAMPFRARSAAAGDYVARLIRKQGKRKGVDLKPPVKRVVLREEPTRPSKYRFTQAKYEPEPRNSKKVGRVRVQLNEPKKKKRTRVVLED